MGARIGPVVSHGGSVGRDPRSLARCRWRDTHPDWLDHFQESFPLAILGADDRNRIGLRSDGKLSPLRAGLALAKAVGQTVQLRSDGDTSAALPQCGLA